ncbi:MAG: hypothetical protein ACOVO3_11410 [Fluviicola sp.]
MASDEMKGRSAGSEEELKATHYVEKVISSQQKIREFTWRVPALNKGFYASGFHHERLFYQ